MKRSMLLTICIIYSMATVGYGFKVMDKTFTKQSRGLMSSEIVQLISTSQYPYFLYAHDNERVYASFNEGGYFEVLSSYTQIFDFTFHNQNIFVASDKGLDVIDLKTKQTERIFNTQTSTGVVGAAEYKGDVYLISDHKVYRKEAYSARFEVVKSFNEADKPQRLFSFENNLFISTQTGLFKFDNHHNFNKVVQAGINHEDAQSLIVDLIRVDNLFVLATKRGIYTSKRNGENWTLNSNINVPLEELTSIEFASTNQRHGRYHGELSLRGLLIGTRKGLFYFNGEDVERLYKGLESEHVNDVLIVNADVYVASNMGVFKLDYLMKEQKWSNDFVFDDLPKINDVHGWAIDYAEVNPSKIDNWRKLAKKKALLPDMSIGFDGGNSWSRSDSLWGSSSGAIALGPDDKGGSGDFGWDVSLSWDLADFIWSTDQTTIDGRSKLMVELREDILSQVTRLYFEHKRLSMELAMSNDYDSDKKLRLDELTAHLDAYTGGKFSKQLKQGEKDGSNINN